MLRYIKLNIYDIGIQTMKRRLPVIVDATLLLTLKSTNPVNGIRLLCVLFCAADRLPTAE